MSRSYLYELIQANKIRSHVIKKPHAVKGIRLIYLPSLREFIESQVNEAPPEVAA